MVDVICKIKCDGYRVAKGWGQFERIRTVDFSFVTADEKCPENKKFWEASPSGKIEIGIANEAALKHLDIGEEYYMIITKTKPAGP